MQSITSLQKTKQFSENKSFMDLFVRRVQSLRQLTVFFAFLHHQVRHQNRLQLNLSELSSRVRLQLKTITKFRDNFDFARCFKLKYK